MDIARDATLHQRILNDLESQIVSGAWAPGHRLPFEVDLAKQYGCSRMTVNKVMTQLAKAGLIERRKKSGSFVTQPQAQSAVLEIHDIKTEVASLKLAYSYALLVTTERDADIEDRRRLGLEKAGPVLEVRCIHLAAGDPFCLEERLINLDVVPDARHADFSTIAPGPWLLERAPWTAAQHNIQAVGADRDMAKLLKLKPETACLVIERRTWNTIGPVTHVRFTYPGTRHRVVADFQPSSSQPR
ncbi:histidine utilization repressor [Corticibacterium sp. UT-5YL-CI-8]|nr:histidine utilization repressor [Tianweitania sp. UT-5YL-CI-8]